MLLQLIRDIEHRIECYGIVTLNDLSVSLGVSSHVIMRAVKAGDFPPPFTRFRKHWWPVAVVRQYFQAESEAAQHVEKEQGRGGAGVQDLLRDNGAGTRA